MNTSLVIALPVLLPFACSLVACLLRKQPSACRAWLVTGLLALVGSALYLFYTTFHATEPLRVDFGGWKKPLGISFKADLLAAIMVLVSSIVGLAGALFAVGEIGRTTWAKNYGTFFFLLMAGINGAFLTNDLFNLFVWFEVMLMASFAMLILGRKKYVFEGATKYVVINMVSSFFFLSGLGVIYGKTGQLNLDHIALQLGQQGEGPVIFSSMALLLLAFGIKSGVFPLYFWLPPAYPNTGFATAAVFGGLLTKVGVYALFRVFGGALGDFSGVTGPLFLWIGVATMVTGVLGAASQFHARRILSFHIISQIGYILIGLGLFTQSAFAAGIFYMVHHILVKTNLFLIAGILAYTGRGERLERLGSLLKTSPGLAMLFLIPALSLGGIPPLSGFLAKFFLLREAFMEHAYVVAVAGLLVGILTLFSMTKIWSEAFWKDTPRKHGLARFSRTHYAPVILLAALTIGVTVGAGPLWKVSHRAAEQLMDTAPSTTLVREFQP